MPSNFELQARIHCKHVAKSCFSDGPAVADLLVPDDAPAGAAAGLLHEVASAACRQWPCAHGLGIILKILAARLGECSH